MTLPGIWWLFRELENVYEWICSTTFAKKIVSCGNVQQPNTKPIPTPIHIPHTLHLHRITGATPLVTHGPQANPLPPEARAKNKLIMSQRVFQSTQCIPLIPRAAGRKCWLIWTGLGSPFFAKFTGGERERGAGEREAGDVKTRQEREGQRGTDRET